MRNNYFHVQSLLQSSNAGKQILGQRIAAYLGFTPGPRGADDGIDGFIVDGTRRIHFQSKLRSVPLDREDARSYYSDIIYHKANVSVIMSGVGFKENFRTRLFGHQGIEHTKIHLLELSDVLEKNDVFKKACLDLPSLRYLDSELQRELNLD
ncbi:hypothetical protein [Vibrio cyclitrophicus]|uniref:hypothetical protein n=1 Tax=Vibrio cyclitrophicus TaxID=47951 RepID=UPI00067E6552|nr:hypothetical protein [Vibrio cyclitrophicus]KNH12769.1 hypothetical protein ACS79_10910 [Vibrio lentus]OBT14150.1 hypothetical protein A9265_03900 [Vibrio cyclitrophicus]PME27948.1 hypothetical protein BCV41_03300 [Vibrio cyclitrophicus]